MNMAQSESGSVAPHVTIAPLVSESMAGSLPIPGAGEESICALY